MPGAVVVLWGYHIRLSAAGHDAPANVSGRRYLTFGNLPNGWQVYLET